MDLPYIKLLLVVNSWMVAKGSPVAMLQHATSSQSFVFHPAASTSSTISAPSSIDQNSGSQAKYEYKYEVSDHQTGDRKSHWESRDGDRVRGVYTLYEPDGALRTVEYSADGVHGFNAVVRRNEPSRHTHPRQEDFKQIGTNSHEGYSPPIHSDHIGERSSFLGQSHANDHTGYPPSKASLNSAVGFSVDHSLKNNRDSSLPPY